MHADAWRYAFVLALVPAGTIAILELFGSQPATLLPLLLLQIVMLGVLGWYLAREAHSRRQAQAALAVGEQQYRLLSEHAQEVVWAVDLACNLTYVSPSVQELRGYTRAEMLAFTWDERIAAGLNPRIVEELRTALAGLAAGRPVNPAPFVVEQVHKYGRVVWTEVSMSPLYDDAGAPIGLRASSRDVTQRVRALAELRRSEDRFAKIFRSSPSGIALSRRADGRYREVNDAFLALTGYTRSELIGHSSLELGILTPATREAILAGMDAEGVAHGMELQIGAKGGERRDVRYVVEPVEVDDEPHLLTTVIDLSAAKALERALRANNEELESRVAQRTAALEIALAGQQRALRARDEFMAMVSHELRTPLTGALAMTELLQEGVSGPLTARQHTYVDAIHANSVRLLDVVNSIIGYTRLVAGDVSLNPEPCSLEELLDLAAHMLRRKAQARQQTLTIAVDPPDLTIVSDPQAVVEVVRRLLDNAVKFTPPGGCIGVEAALLAGAQRAPNSSPVVQITVWDTGPGLDPASLPDLAKPFTQGDASLSRSHEGIGMGLAHVCHLVPLLGGQFELAPNPGGGARFCFTLPAELTPEGWKDTVEESMRGTQ